MDAFAHLPVLFLLPLAVSAADSSVLMQSTLPESRDGEQRRSQLQVDWLTSPNWQLQWRHDYRIFDFTEQSATTSPEPSTSAANNGHVHQLALALTAEQSRWWLRVQPLIATSSNALRERALHRADWRLQGEIAFRFSLHEEDSLQLGLRLDDHLGRYRAYPSIRWCPVLPTTMQLQLGWPDTDFRWSLTDAWQLRGFLTPAGGQWHVYDEKRERDSELYYRQWLLGAELRWQLAEHWQLHAGLQREFDERLHYVLQDGQTVTSRQADQMALQLSLQFAF